LGNGSAEKAVAQTPDAGQRGQLLRILKETRGRVGGAEGAAARLGLKRTTLLSRMKKLGIDPRAVS
jgi:formate hydrogenlyase transcriptional activator